MGFNSGFKGLKSTACGASRFGSQVQVTAVCEKVSVSCSKCHARAWRYMGFYVPCVWLGWTVNMNTQLLYLWKKNCYCPRH